MARRAPKSTIYPAYPSEPISDIREMFVKSTRKNAKKIALQQKKDGCWVPIAYEELRDEVESISRGLAALRAQPITGKLAIVGDNRPEWAIGYLAAACTGIVCVPIDKDLKETEVYNILCLSGAQVLIADDKHMEMILTINSRLPELAAIVNMDQKHPVDGVISFSELRRKGEERLAAGKNDFEERTVSSDQPLSIFFLIFGYYGQFQRRHADSWKRCLKPGGCVEVGGSEKRRQIPFHSPDPSQLRMHGWISPGTASGRTTSYAESLRRIAENMAETRTTAILGVPLLWHAIYKKIEAGMAENGIWKVNAAKKLAAFTEKILGLSIRRLLFAKVHAKFGGCLRILISGGAAVDPAVARGFRELGIAFLQGYGLTESAPIIAVNRNAAFRDDSAGLPLPSVEVMIAEDGEILARGPNIMKGYYNNPDATRDVLEDGWLHTGDLGYIDDEGFLYIQGREEVGHCDPGREENLSGRGRDGNTEIAIHIRMYCLRSKR